MGGPPPWLMPLMVGVCVVCMRGAFGGGSDGALGLLLPPGSPLHLAAIV